MIQLFDLLNDSQMQFWDDYVKSHPKGTPFHLSNWIKTIYETYQFEPLMYVKVNNENKISGIFPCFLIKLLFNKARIVSLPFSDYGGPLCNLEHTEQELIQTIIDNYKGRINYFEIRSRLSNTCSLISHNFYRRHILMLDKDTDISKIADRKTIQYSMRKALKSGVEISEESNEWGISQFCRLNTLTRKKHGVPSQTHKFFEKLYDYMISCGHGSIYIANWNAKVIAASLFLKLGNTLYYKYNASDPLYLSTKTPNHLLTWHVINQAHLSGYQLFDFGRTSSNNAGLMRHKKLWGAEELDCPYYFYPKIKGVVSMEDQGISYRLFTKLWRLVPDTAAEFIGPKLLRYTA